MSKDEVKAWELVSHYCQEAALHRNREKEDEEASSYANQSYSPGLKKPWIVVGKEWSLPSRVVEMYDREGTVFHGTFPEIRRAWAFLGKSLILWHFDRWGQLSEHNEEQPISAVGLVKPKPGFVESAQYLLVMATPVELFLFGVYGEDHVRQMSLEKLVDYNTSSDGVTFSCIASTHRGRIFLAGQNGHIYELVYTIGVACRIVCCTRVKKLLKKLSLVADDPVVEMVVDEERNMLYARTQKMKLEAYFIGVDGESPIQKVGGVDNLSKKLSIVCISPLTKLESKWSHAHLVAVLSDGSRMYLSTSSSGNDWKELVLGRNNKTPSCLRVVSVKPRPETPRMDNSVKVETAYCPVGTLFLSPQSPHSAPGYVVIVGKDSSMHTQGRLLFAADVLPSPAVGSAMLPLYSQVVGETCEILNGRGELLTQHVLPKKKILLFSTTTVKELVFNRPIDILDSILSEVKFSRVALNAFDDHFGADETAAMCLMLASRIMSGSYELVSIGAADVFEDLKTLKMPQLGGTNLSASHRGLYLYVLHELESKIRSLEKCLMRRSGDGGELTIQGLTKEDGESMECCWQLILRSAEALSLLQILARHDVAIVAGRSGESLSRSLLELKFCHLVDYVEGDQIAKVLISAIMENLPKPESILKQYCPSYWKKAQGEGSNIVTPTTATPPVQVVSKRLNAGKKDGEVITEPLLEAKTLGAADF